MVERRSDDEGEPRPGSFDPPFPAGETSDLAFDDDGFDDDLDGRYDDGRFAADDAAIQAALDSWEAPAHVRDRPLPSRLSSWSRSSLLGAMAAGIGLGLREVLDPPRDEAIVIEVDADGEPHDLPIRLLLDPDDPSGSLCIVRRDPPPPLV